jgi:hypothetical protein
MEGLAEKAKKLGHYAGYHCRLLPALNYRIGARLRAAMAGPTCHFFISLTQLWPRSTFVLIPTMAKESTDICVDLETAAPVLGNKDYCFLIVVKLAIGSTPSPAIC